MRNTKKRCTLVLIILLGAATFLLVKDWLTQEQLPAGQDFTTEQTLD